MFFTVSVNFNLIIVSCSVFIGNADLEAKCEELNCKLEESVQSVAHLKTQYNKLEEEFTDYKNRTSSSAEDFTCLKENLDTVSQQLGKCFNILLPPIFLWTI